MAHNKPKKTALPYRSNHLVLHLNIVILILLVFCTPLTAQQQAPIKLYPDWKEGDHISYIVVRSTEIYSSEGYRVFPADTSLSYHIQVIAKDEESYIIEWKTVYEDPNHAFPTAKKEFNRQFRYLFKTDRKGNFIELLNKDEFISLHNEWKRNHAAEGRNSETESHEFLDLPMDSNTATELCKKAIFLLFRHFNQELYPNKILSDKSMSPSYINPVNRPMVFFTRILENSSDKLILEQTYHLSNPVDNDRKAIEQRSEIIAYDRHSGWLERSVYRHSIPVGDGQRVETLEVIRN